jgi:hypothetical protein
MPIHGTRSMYVNGKCRCENCKAANAAWQKNIRARRALDRELFKVEHGTLNAYTNYGCRCPACKSVQSERYKAWAGTRKAVVRPKPWLERRKGQPEG